MFLFNFFPLSSPQVMVRVSKQQQRMLFPLQLPSGGRGNDEGRSSGAFSKLNDVFHSIGRGGLAAGGEVSPPCSLATNGGPQGMWGDSGQREGVREATLGAAGLWQ